MKAAQLERKSDPLDQVVLITTMEEAKILYEALQEYVKTKPRLKKAKVLLNELEHAPLWN